MKDRLSLYPGRVTMTPVPGQANTYDMVRADQPVEVGDVLNKANLLPDDVCAALGIPTTSVPRDALSRLFALNVEVGTRIDTLDESVAALLAHVPYVMGSFTRPSSNNATVTLGFRPKIVICYAKENNHNYVDNYSGTTQSYRVPRVLTSAYSDSDGTITDTGFTHKFNTDDSYNYAIYYVAFR